MSPPLDAAPRFVRRKDVIARQLPDRTVLLNGSTGSCFELNPVGSSIWDALDGSRSLDEISARIAEAFRLEPGVAATDVARFAESLRAADLIEPAEQAP